MCSPHVSRSAISGPVDVTTDGMPRTPPESHRLWYCLVLFCFDHVEVFEGRLCSFIKSDMTFGSFRNSEHSECESEVT